MFWYFIRRSDRKRYTAKQRHQAALWAVFTAVIIVVIATMTVH